MNVHPAQAMRASAAAGWLLSAAGLVGCAQPAGTLAPVTLSQAWMFGIERMRGDPEPQLPLTNRFIADLSAMPNAQVVFVSNERNNFLFNAWQGSKVLVAPWLRGEGNCMNVTYTLFQSGEQQGVFGLVVSPMPAGTEPDPACVDRAAAQFYRTVAAQGL